MKILINTPDIDKPGGVANHYKGLKNFWTHEVRYNYTGGRKSIPGPLILPYDYIKFFFLCLFGSFDAIVLNPSLGKTAVKRDSWFLQIANLCNKKTLVFFHGWNESVAESFDKTPEKFHKLFGKSDTFIVLASPFKRKLRSWGIRAPIWITTTKVDNQLLKEFDFESKNKIPMNILFLARLEREKGIFVALEAFKLISETYKNLKFDVAGTGTALEDAQTYCQTRKISNVNFLGNISGQNLIDTFANSDIYILPTTHGEGMPTSILEAMAFGLPIISRPVGGLIDFFEEGKMGYLVESLEPHVYADKIIQLLKDKSKIKEIGRYNYEYAKTRFMASEVALDIEEIIKNETYE